MKTHQDSIAEMIVTSIILCLLIFAIGFIVGRCFGGVEKVGSDHTGESSSASSCGPNQISSS